MPHLYEAVPLFGQALSDADEARLERLQDVAGFSADKARQTVTGVDSEGVQAAEAHIPQPRKPQTPSARHSRRGGRSYPEGTENELDPNWNPQPAPSTPEELADQEARNTRGRQLANRVLAVSTFDGDVRAARKLGTPLIVVQQARIARWERRQQSRR